MGVAQAGEDSLAGVRVAADLKGGILLGNTSEGAAHLVQVGLGLGEDGAAEGRLGEGDTRQNDGLLAAAQGVTRDRLGQLGHRTDVAGYDLPYLLLALASDHEQGPDALRLALVGVPGLGVGLEGARIDAEVGEPAHVGVGGGLEDQGCERSFAIGLERLAILDLHRDVRGRGEIGAEGVHKQ